MTQYAVQQVKRSIKKWPAYQKYAESLGINPLKIRDIGELPVLDKTFIAQAIHTVPLCRVRTVVPSSGSTGQEYSFGLFSDGEIKKTALAIEKFLQKRYGTKTRKTLILNLLPGALTLWSSTATVASIGVRMDTALSVIQAMGSSFEQIILAGEPLFIKNLLEYGMRHAISWEYLPLSIVVGGEWVPESYRTYIEGIVGYRRVASSFGMAELGLHYFFETEETVLLRNLLFQDRRLRRALLGDIGFCPMLFAFDDTKIYVETLRETACEPDSILLTTLDPDRVMPLLRFRTGDKGRKLSLTEINRCLKEGGYRPIPDSVGPDILAHFGRGVHCQGVYVEEVKEKLYAVHKVISASTGNFMLEDSKNGVTVTIQMQKEASITADRVDACLDAFHEVPVMAKLCPYDLFPVPLDYERKVRYVGEGDHCRRRKGYPEELSAQV